MKITFPQSFIFGIADADLQVIGEKNCLSEEHSEPTAWTQFAKTSGKVCNNDTPEIGIDRYNLWKEDIEHLKKLGIKHYRTSVSVSRILDKNGDVNRKAIEWYRRYFKSLKQAGISVYVTLYHWEMPMYMQEKGGWLNAAVVDLLAKHARVVAEELGEFVTEYFLINEPRMDTFYSYYEGGHQPGHENLQESLLAAHHCLLAQGAMYNEVSKSAPNTPISTVVNIVHHYAETNSTDDISAANYANSHHNKWFLDPIFKGTYPSDTESLVKDKMPEYGSGDMKLIKIGNKLNSIGINYYNCEYVRYAETSDFRFEYVDIDGCLTNDLYWPVAIPPEYPEGLYDVLCWVYHTYQSDGLKQIYITENGYCQIPEWDGGSGPINDSRRIFYLREHLKMISKAQRTGVPITAYFEWTLMDNFEWGSGYTPGSSFGIIHVDRKSLRRIWKQSAHWYSNVIKRHSLD